MYKAAAAVICMCLLAGCQSNEKMQTNKPHSQAAANHAKRENHHTKEKKTEGGALLLYQSEKLFCGKNG